MMRYSTILLALLCVACGNYSANIPTIKPYKMDIQQGNVVTPKMMMQLRPGMTKSQVRFIMGTPLLVDSFHSDRWDYFYQMRKDGKIIEQRRIILDFDGDSLAHVRGDVIPAGSDPTTAAKQSTFQAPKSISQQPTAKEKGMLDKLKFWGDDESKQDSQKATTQPAEPAKLEVKPELKAEDPMPTATEPAQPPTHEAAGKPAAQEEKKGWLDKLKFWGDDEKAVPAAKAVEPVKSAPAKIQPAAAEPTVAEPAKPEPVKVETKTSMQTAAQPAAAPQPEAASKLPPQPAADLPAEDAPDFFEKMLEKIGF